MKLFAPSSDRNNQVVHQLRDLTEASAQQQQVLLQEERDPQTIDFRSPKAEQPGVDPRSVVIHPASEKMLQRASQEAQIQKAIQNFDSLLQCHRLRGLLGPVDFALHQRGRASIAAYDLTRLVGRGGYCQVWEARCITDEAVGTTQEAPKVAIKIISKALYASRKRMNLLADEINVIQHVRHTNVISAKQVLHGRECVFVVMELAAMNISMYKRKYGNRMDDDCMRTMLKGVLGGLTYLHDMGIAHMDLKPDNILIQRDVPPEQLAVDDIRICDLGLCVVSGLGGEAATVVNTRRGTPGLMAPEVYQKGIGSERYYDATKADIWSLGVILMGLVGCIPNTWMELYKDYNWRRFELSLGETMNELYSNLEVVDAELADLIVQMLNVRPGDRLTVHQVLRHDWVTQSPTTQNIFQKIISKVASNSC